MATSADLSQGPSTGKGLTVGYLGDQRLNLIAAAALLGHSCCTW
jgi:hypothetical protein